MKALWRWIRRALIALVVVVLALLSPVAYVETMCQGDGPPAPYAALLPPEHHRSETRTLMSFPEWQIVHAYEDYAEVIRTSDPHEFNYLASVGGFWSSLCNVTTASATLGDIDGPTKQMVYVIGVSFTAELAMKALYEETIGRVATLIRGDTRAPADDLSAGQAAAYAQFLTQVPWYRWTFREDAAALSALTPTGLRDRERRLALGLEYRAKAAYADVIAAAVASTGFDELTLRLVLAPGAPVPVIPDVTVIETTDAGTILETPRYRALTLILWDLAQGGHDFAEIAGNDDILFTLLSDQPSHPGAIHSEPRQGFGDHRHLVMVKVTDLAAALRGLAATGARLEHIHDY
jgi:hypothetical protein